MGDTERGGIISFEDLVARLTSDAQAGVAAGAVTQVMAKRSFLERATQVDDLDLVAAGEEDEEINLALRRFLPEEGLRAGLPYTPAGPGTVERPPFRQALGVEVLRSDFRISRSTGKATLKPAGIERIRRSVRESLSAKRLAAMKEVARQGLPTITVDSGSVTVRGRVQTDADGRVLAIEVGRTASDDLEPREIGEVTIHFKVDSP